MKAYLSLSAVFWVIVDGRTASFMYLLHFSRRTTMRQEYSMYLLENVIKNSQTCSCMVLNIQSGGNITHEVCRK